LPSFTPAPTGLLQRKCACGGGCASCSEKSKLQRFAREPGDALGGVPEIVNEVIGGGGRPLEPGVQRTMESRFGQDFSRVRVHDGPRAAESARAVRALAYTVGRDVVFADGHYRPHDRAGQRLIAHELAHVAQQRAGAGTRVQPQSVSAAHDPLEHEADRAADLAMAGAHPALSSGGGRSLMRQPAAGASPEKKGEAAPTKATVSEKSEKKEPKKPSPFEYVGKTGYGKFRAEYDPEEAVLHVTMKVKFDFDLYASTWLGHEDQKQKFVSDFINKNQATWSGRYVLVPDGDSQDYKAPVAVKIRIERVTGGEHYTVFAKYSEYPMAENAPERVTSDGAAHISSDALQGAIRGGKGFANRFSTPALHEFGHMLGLAHIGADKAPICAEPGSGGRGGSAATCYGTTEDELNDIMGRGSFVSPRDYQPFVECMNVLAPKTKWKVAEPRSGGLPWWAYAALIAGGVALAGIGIGVGIRK
jgi:hypothetical protein